MAVTLGTVPDDDPRIVATTFDRMRLGVLIQLVGVVIGLGSSRSMGIPLPTIVISINIVVLSCGVVVLVAIARNWIAPRRVHDVVALVWLLSPVTTLSSLIATGEQNLVFPILIEVALAAAIQVSWKHLVGSTSVAVATYTALALVDSGPDTPIHVASVVGLTVSSWLVQRAMRRSMDAAILREDAHARTALLLEAELEKRRIAEDQRACAEADRERLRDQFVHAQRMDAVGTLAAGLAHDMNNILSGILGVAEIAIEETSSTQTRADLTAIAEQAKRAAELTKSLLAYSRRGPYQKTAVSIDSVVDGVEPLLSRMFGNRVSMERRGGSDATIEADTAQLGQALVNLCINGADAMEGTGTLTLTTGVVDVDARAASTFGIEPGRFAIISVADNGCGMDDETRTQVFEPFFTTKEVGKGTGLGLAMVWGTVKGHGGAIEVHSAPTQGSTFTIYLPVSAASVIPRTMSRRDSGKLRAPQKLALVVDDEPHVRGVVTRVLRQMGLSVIGAGDGAEALDVFGARHDEISLVVLDMSMPVMGGAECMRALRRRSSVPIVIASGFANEAETQSLLELGGTSFLEKPFSVDSLREHVERLLAPS